MWQHRGRSLRSMLSGDVEMRDGVERELCVYVGVYGDVSRVKIMFNKKDTALVQFADPAQAHIGQSAASAHRPPDRPPARLSAADSL